MITVIALFCHAVVSAQQEDDYYRYKYDPDAVARPLIGTDTLLFYRIISNKTDLFDELTSYSFRQTAYARRGLDFTERATLLDGITVRWNNVSTLRKLGFTEYGYAGTAQGRNQTSSMVGTDEFSSSDGTPADGVNIGTFFSGRGYLGGARATISATIKRGWSMTLHASARGGNDLYVKGVYTDAADLGLRLTKLFTSGATFAFTAVATVADKGLRSGSTQEAFSLTGNNLYNPTWGRQQGKIRNSRTRRDRIPFAAAAYSTHISSATTMRISAGADYGVRCYSSPSWYDAVTPAPDNYRKMPSYFTLDTTAAAVSEQWRAGNERYTQIDWAELYRINRHSTNGAVYTIDDRVERTAHLQADLLFDTDAGHNITVSYGLHADYDNSRQYRRMRDLLDGTYIRDLDYFLVDDDTYSNKLQNDMRNPDRYIGEGDRFSYDYSLTRQSIEARARVRYDSGHWHADASVGIGNARIFRTGYYEKELFAGDKSYGRSAVKTFNPYTLKLSIGYAFTPKQYIDFAIMAAATTPEADDMFLNPLYNNRITDSPKVQHRMAAEASYRLSASAVDLTFTAYASSVEDARRMIRTYDDLSATYCDVDISDIGTASYGTEVAAKIRLSRRLTASLAASAGRYYYTSNQKVTHYSDSDNTIISNASPSYMGSCHVGGAPQLCGTASLTYMDYKGWAASIGAQVAAMRYVDPSFIRRTERVARQASASEEIYSSFMAQQRLDDACTLDASVSRWFNTGIRSRIAVTLSVSNLLGNKDIIYDGYEPSRIRRYISGTQTIYRPHENIVTYAYPRTFYAVISWKF